jgi:hypothetical protein
MIRNTDKRLAGGVPTAADGTAKNRMYGVFQIENRGNGLCIMNRKTMGNSLAIRISGLCDDDGLWRVFKS